MMKIASFLAVDTLVMTLSDLANPILVCEMLATTMIWTMVRPIAISIGLPKHGVVDMPT